MKFFKGNLGPPGKGLRGGGRLVEGSGERSPRTPKFSKISEKINKNYNRKATFSIFDNFNEKFAIFQRFFKSLEFFGKVWTKLERN